MKLIIKIISDRIEYRALVLSFDIQRIGRRNCIPDEKVIKNSEDYIVSDREQHKDQSQIISIIHMII